MGTSYQEYQSGIGIYTVNDYSDSEIKAMQAEQARIATAKANERAAVMMIVRSLPLEIQPIGSKLSTDLSTLADAMKKYAGSTMTSDLNYGLTGNGADAAKDFLTHIKRPDLKSPVKGV